MKKAAFTLVEILLSLAILGVGLVSILSVFVVGTNSIRRTVALTEASFFAQLIIEDLKRQVHTNPNNITSPTLPQHYIDNGYTFKPYPLKLESINGVSNLYKIELIIKKNDKEVEKFTTYITKYEP